MALFAYIIVYSFVAINIIDCNTVYSLLLPKNMWNMVKLLSMGAFLPLTLSFFTWNTLKKERNMFFWFCYVLLLCSMLVFLLPQHRNGFLSRFILLFPFMIVYFSYVKNNRRFLLFSAFVQEMTFVAVLSLVLWYLGPISNYMKPTGMSFLPWGSGNFAVHYYHLQYETQYMIMFGHEIIRNSGFFAEAPMFNYCLCLALFLDLFVLEKRNLLFELILMTAIFTTFTTMGMLVLLGVVSMILIRKIMNSKNMVVLFLGCLCVPVIIIAFAGMSFLLMKDKSSSRSYGSRSGGIQYGISKFIHSPLIGNGYATAMEGVGSNSLFLVLAEGGIMLGAFYYIPLLYVPYKHRRRNPKEFYFSLFYGFLFSLTMIAYANVTLIMVAYFYANYLRKPDRITYGRNSYESNLLY